jgi:phage FluMu protein Com
MPPAIRCAKCSQPLTVPDSAAGQRLKCPRCQTVFRAPDKSPPPAPAVHIHFSCSCCKLLLQAGPGQAGQAIRCPRCQTTLLVPSGAVGPPGRMEAPVPAPRPAPASVPAPAPATVPAVAPQAILLPPGTPARDAPQAIPLGPPLSIPSPHRAGGRSVGVWVGVAVGVLVLLGGIVGARSLFRQPTSTGTGTDEPLARKGETEGPASPTDLAFIPADCLAIVSLRVGDVWNSRLIQQGLGQLPPEARQQMRDAEQTFDFHMTDFERVTVVYKDTFGQSFWAVLKTTRPYDRARRTRLLSRNKIQWKEHTYRGLVYQVGTAPEGPGNPTEPLAVFIASDHVFVAGTEAGVRNALDHFRNGRKDGALNGVLPLIEGGKHQLLVAGALTPEARKELEGKARMLPETMRGLLDVQSAVLKVDLARTLKLEVVSSYPSGEKAAQARQILESLKTLVQLIPASATNAQEQEFVRQIAAVLATVDVRAVGRDVVIRADVDLDRLAMTMAKLVAGKFQVESRDVVGEGNLKRLALGLRSYHDAQGHYPPAVVHGPEGRKPLYSWRVAVLPYLGEEALYREFHHDEPWDSVHNRRLIERMPAVFDYPALSLGGERGKTSFQLLVGPQAAFDGGRLVKAGDIRDGPSNTLLLVGRRPLVPWTAPEDARVPDDPAQIAREFLPSLGLQGSDRFPAALFDGSIRSLKRTISPRTFLQAVTPRGGEPLPADW